MYDNNRKISCDKCVELKKAKGKKPDCIACGKPILHPNNYLCYGIFENYSGVLFNGMGGLNAEGIRLAMDMEGVPLQQQPELCKKIILFCRTALNKSNNNGEQDG